MSAKFLRACREANATLDLRNRTCLIIGGTQGIGAAVADKFKAMGGRTIIAGRTDGRGHEAHEFRRVDLSLMKDIHRFTEDIKQEFPKVDDLLLIQTAGGPPTGKIIDTAEGLERHFAVQCLGRFIVAHQLAPLLRKGSVVWVAAPAGDYRGLDLDDLEVRKVPWWYRLPVQGMRDSAFLDAMAIELAARHGLRVGHLFPGYIDTRAVSNQGFPSLVVGLQRIVAPLLATQAIDYADIPIFAATSQGFTQPSPRLSNPSGATLQPNAWASDKHNRDRLWDRAVMMYEEARLK